MTASDVRASTGFQDVQRSLNDHCLDCPVCRSADKGLCEVADRLLDELLGASTPGEDES